MRKLLFPNNAEQQDVQQQDMSQQLAYANSLLEATFDSVSVGVLVVDRERKTVSTNKRFRTLWGIPLDLPPDTKVLPFVLAKLKDSEQFLARLDEIYADPLADSYDIIDRNDQKTFERLSTPQRIGDQIVGRVWTYRDITSTTQTEQALRESEQRYRTLLATERRHVDELRLLDQVRTALIGKLDLQSVFRTALTAISDSFALPYSSIYLVKDGYFELQHYTGYENPIPRFARDHGSCGRVLRLGCPELVPALNDDPDHQKYVDKYEDKQKFLSGIFVPLWNDDEAIGVLSIASMEKELADADLKLMVALGEYISLALRQASLHTEIRQRGERFRQIFELAPIGMATADLEGRLLQVNQALCHTLGYTESELCTMCFQDITYPEDLPSHLALHQQLVEGNTSHYQLEKRYIRKNGTLVDTFLRVGLLQNPDENPRHIVCQLVDISERKKNEESLRQTQKVESLGVLSGGIAHDFNNLLTSILAQSSFALDYLSPSEKAHANIEKVVKAAQQATGLTRQLLAYSGHGQFENKPIDINQVVRDNVSLLDVAVASNAHLVMDLADQLPLIEGDASQIQQLVMNLIMNAAESISSENGTITILTELSTFTSPEKLHLPLSTSLAAGTYVTLRVKDTGGGMDTETLSKIFDPFYTTKPSGRGLGLATVLGIVRSHGGGLQVNSVVDQGTCFCVFFPTSSAERPLIPALETDDVTSALNGSVLVIDDQAFIVEAICEILEHTGLTTVQATSGEEGIRLFKEQKADIGLILLDLSMPGLSGKETLLQLRQFDIQVPVILTSGYSQTEITGPFFESNANGFLPKPYTWDQLIKTVQQHLGT